MATTWIFSEFSLAVNVTKLSKHPILANNNKNMEYEMLHYSSFSFSNLNKINSKNGYSFLYLSFDH